MMGEEKKIAVDEVDKVDTPPRARVTPETPAETLERKRDYLAGFLAEQPKQAPAHGPGGDLQEAIVEALKTIYDPEIPVDIYELGLIYAVEIQDDGKVKVEMTLTTPSCPSAQELPSQVEESVRLVPGVTDVQVEVVWDPPWDQGRMSEDARLALNMF